MPLESRQRVALVYPPFGPAGLPSLGLGLLSAAVKAVGFECRTYYWNLQFARRLPGNHMSTRLHTYWWLTQRPWHPFSEWVFARAVYDDALAAREPATLALLCAHGRAAGTPDFKDADLLALRDQADELLEEAMEPLSKAHVIGIATTFFQSLPALALARRVKQRWPEKCVVLGGANCDGPMGPALLKNFLFLDYVLCGEADVAFPEFLRRRAAPETLNGTGGIISRGTNGVIQGVPAEPVSQLNELPLPDFDDFVEQRERFGVAGCQNLVLALESSRGCWWGAKQHCTFCGLNANGMAYRRKRKDRFDWELKATVKKYDAKFIFMADNILPAEYYDNLNTWSNGEPRPHLFYEIKSNAKRAQVADFIDAGITAVQPGIESFSSALLALMKKGVTAAQNVAFLRWAREYGLRVGYNLLTGFPGGGSEVYDSMLRSLPRLFHLYPPGGVVPIEYHRFSPYHQHPEAYGLKLRPTEGYSLLYPLPESEISELAYIFYAEQKQGDVETLERLDAVVTRWKSVYKRDDCTLTWRENGDFIEISDRRPDFGPKKYRLQGYACEVFRQFDEPRTIAGLVNALKSAVVPTEEERFLRWAFAPEPDAGTQVIAFETGDFTANPRACLQPLLDGALLFEDVAALPRDMTGLGDRWGGTTRYVALPVHVTYRAEDKSWNTTGV